MKITYKQFLLFSLLFVSHILIAQPSINGDIDVCIGDCIDYSVDNGLGGPYFWQSTGNITTTNSEASISICWEDNVDQTLTVTDFAVDPTIQTFSVNVDVDLIPAPDLIIPPYPGCVVRDSLGSPDGNTEQTPIECYSVCSGSTIVYTSIIHPGNTVTWIVEGGIVINSSDESLEVEWNQSGAASITMIESSPLGCMTSETFCIEILEPLDIDIVALGGGTDDISICLNQEVYFLGIGHEDITQFEWSVSNGAHASGANASFVFDESGTYEVSLVGKTECGCTESSTYQVIVDINPGPSITCTGTSCAGEEQTYYAADNCSAYNWSIDSHGTIIDGGGVSDNYVSVLWNSGPVGQITLDVSGCDQALCAQPTIVQIPIIDNSANISGPSTVCKGGYNSYSVQYYSGTEYNWSLAGNGQIISGHGTNEVTIAWESTPWSDDQATLEVAFENCYLECGGNASFIIDLQNRFELNHQPLYCTDRNTYISAYDGWNYAEVDFEITSPSGIISNYNATGDVSENFTEIGVYQVTAEDSQGKYCNDVIKSSFEITAQPIAPSSISGPTTICINEYYNYSAPINETSENASWKIMDGSNTTIVRANTITVQWKSAGPYQLELTVFHNEIYCPSDPVTFDISPAQTATITGSSVVCADEVSNYSVGLVDGSSSSWAIDPPSAGSIISNSNNTIDVMWHEPGSHTIQSDFCGASILYNVEVKDNTVAVVDFPEKVCAGEQGIIDITVPSGTNIEIVDQNDNFISNSISTQVDPGMYLATITTIDGCKEEIPIAIDSFARPSIRVSSPDGNAYCLPHRLVEITALDTDEGYTYEWYFKGVPMGLTTPSIMVNDYGKYFVIVTDKNGCTAESNIHRLVEWCEGDRPPGTCSGGGGGGGPVGIDNLNIRCDNLQFSITGSTYLSTDFDWNFSDPDSGPNNTATGFSPIHDFTNAGHYYVFALGNVGNEEAVEIFTIPAAPKFDYDLACTGQKVQFNNHSTFLPNFGISGYTWDFGDPSSGADNTSTDRHPTHIYSAAGMYTVTLDIVGSNGCISAFQVNVEVKDGPFAEFVLPQSTCASEGLEFIAFQDTEIINYEWDFDDPVSGEANSSTSPRAIHTFSSSGTYDVSLTVYGLNGCPTTRTKQVVVTTNNLNGDIQADQAFPICYGSSVNLEAPAGGINYLWSNGDIGQSISTDEAGLYSVTITTNSGCAYSPPAINVVVQGVFDSEVKGYVYEENDFIGTLYPDSLTICQYEDISLNVAYLFNASYEWSDGISTNQFVQSNTLQNLAPGRYEYQVTITDPVTNCAIGSNTYIVNVNALPSSAIVTSTSSSLCEGEPHTLVINNPENDVTYYWNNGAIGESITVSNSGYYFPTAINANGCSREGGGLSVNAVPDAGRVNSGCVTACFPDTVCLPFISGAFNYTWLKDGVVFNNDLSQDLLAHEAGDYQLIVQNFYGCADTSDILSIEAEPSDQSLEGIVFIDDNNDGVWNSGEELLSGVNVNLYQGSSLESTVVTDANGYYLFDPINITNPIVEIDTIGLGLNGISGVMEADIKFNTCVEDKEQNFPLIQNCASIETSEDIYICSNETIVINNISLSPGDSHSFDALTSLGCDSTNQIFVYSYPESEISMTPTATCEGVNEGVLDITVISGSGMQFAVDNPTDFTNNLTFTNLSAGGHTLWLFDSYGCSTSYNFNIPETVAPLMSIVTDKTCYGGNSGVITITPPASGTFEYSIDGINFQSSNTFEDLPSGNITVYISDTGNSCKKEYPITIEENEEPSINITAGNTCLNEEEGVLTIDALTSGNYEYSLDGITYSANNEFINLAEGSYTVYLLENGVCSHIYPASISVQPEPVSTLSTEDACPGESNGMLFINSTSNTLQYSIDQVNFSSDSLFSNLGAGSYQLYVMESNGCIHPKQFTIEESPEMEVEFTDPSTDCSTTQVTLDPVITTSVGQLEFTWSDGSNKSTIEALETGLYAVTISDKCTEVTYDWDIEIDEIIREQPLYFPNIFSPNQDGINDCFYPTLNPKAQVLNFNLLIFDRWGNKVFETDNLDDCWDGQWNSKDVRSGVFVYQIDMDYTYCVEVKSLKKVGDVTIAY